MSRSARRARTSSRSMARPGLRLTRSAIRAAERAAVPSVLSGPSRTAIGVRGQLRGDTAARMDAELGEDILDMVPHGMRAHVELIGDLPVRRSAREQTRNLRLTTGQ